MTRKALEEARGFTGRIVNYSSKWANNQGLREALNEADPIIREYIADTMQIVRLMQGLAQSEIQRLTGEDGR